MTLRINEEAANQQAISLLSIQKKFREIVAQGTQTHTYATISISIYYSKCQNVD